VCQCACTISLPCASLSRDRVPHQVLEMLCARVEQFITQRGRAVAALTSHQRRNKSNLLHSLLADPSISDAVVSNGISC
jgi:hypothetical protein